MRKRNVQFNSGWTKGSRDVSEEGQEKRTFPPPDYYAMMRELHGIGNNLNQIAVKAHTLNVLDVQRYDEACRKIDTAVKKITEAVILPRPMK